MRAITGWRFLLVIALPIFLASLGVMLLTNNLLERVSTSGNEAEHQRNRDVITQALKASEAELGQLVRDNAYWDEAYARMAPKPDTEWIRSTWGNANSINSPYDAAVVFAANSPVPQLYGSQIGGVGNDLRAYLGKSYDALLSRAATDGLSPALATSFVQTSDGPMIAALSPIIPVTAGLLKTGQETHYLLFLRRLTQQQFAVIELRYLIDGLRLNDIADGSEGGVTVANAAGEAVFSVTWQDRRLGDLATATAWQNARAVLGFLIVVMTGVAVVCWRLIQSVIQKETRARHDALHDALTQLPNRSALLEKIRALRAAHNTSFALAFADLDGFKDVNDSYGHDLGDRLIRAVAAGIQELGTGAHMICRMGGDEFVALFTGPSPETDAREFAARMIGFLAKPFDMEGRIASVGASVGIASSDGRDADELELLRRADVAMYKAKANGKNRACVYDATFDAEREENASIASELKGIIAAGSLDIAFQPVIDARTVAMSGVEALARWPMSSQRTFAPDRFIGIAETAGLVDELGDLILEKACRAAQNWPELRLAVNISAVQLNNPKFVKRSLAIIEAHGIAPGRVEFEITETSLIRETQRAKDVFRQLQLAGIKIALDDFGTGFSSIGYLRTFSFDRIKIDKSIVSKVLSNPAELAIVQGTLLVARGLSAEVTAEGVEHEDEVAVLRLAGCTELQGYFFHKPLAASEITALLEKSRLHTSKRVLG